MKKSWNSLKGWSWRISKKRIYTNGSIFVFFWLNFYRWEIYQKFSENSRNFWNNFLAVFFQIFWNEISWKLQEHFEETSEKIFKRVILEKLWRTYQKWIFKKIVNVTNFFSELRVVIFNKTVLSRSIKTSTSWKCKNRKIVKNFFFIWIPHLRIRTFEEIR